MRWWLGLAFAAVAALTAIAVVALLSARSEEAFRRYGKEFAVGNSVAAAEALKADSTDAGVARHATVIAERQHLAIFVFERSGHPLSRPNSFGLPWSKVPNRDAALRTALAGNRYIQGRNDGSAYTIGLPIHRGAGAALVAYSLRPELRDQLGIVRNEYLQSALIAFGVGAALGLLIATLTARRLARIARAASAIGSGNFDVTVSSALPDEVGSLAASIEQMRAQLQHLFRTLEGDRDRLERLLDRLNEGVLLIDRDLNVEFANDRARELLGAFMRLDRLGGGSQSGDAVTRLAQDLFSVRLPAHLRLTGDDRSLLVSGIPPGEGGDSAIVVAFDETQRERNERVQREFATNAAHELRTPLASIVTAVEMLRTGAKDEPGARDEFLDVIAREADRLTRLTRALLMLARAELRDELPPFTPVEVAPLLGQVAASLPARSGLEILVDCPSALAVHGDADLLEQALSSVAVNAVQHTSRGRVILSGRRDNGSVVIEVVDTGKGIAVAEQGRLFERFYQGSAAANGRPVGFGLGLSIAREAVTALGGEIAIDSEPAMGTTVRFVLPSSGGWSCARES
ncbi:MAG TPA: ATP-binding protein [Gaiellaceae bacterium]|nr:ATP-binding protein [Gaiellaceae bacterium]